MRPLRRALLTRVLPALRREAVFFLYPPFLVVADSWRRLPWPE